MEMKYGINMNEKEFVEKARSLGWKEEYIEQELIAYKEDKATGIYMPLEDVLKSVVIPRTFE